jgi:hypothetical protein
LLHLEVGTADRHHPGTILQAREHEEIPEEVPMGTDPQVSLAHHLECRHLLDTVWIQVL